MADTQPIGGTNNVVPGLTSNPSDENNNPPGEKYIPSSGTAGSSQSGEKSIHKYQIKPVEVSSSLNAAIGRLAGQEEPGLKNLSNALTAMMISDGDLPLLFAQVSKILDSNPPQKGVELVRNELTKYACDILIQMRGPQSDSKYVVPGWLVSAMKANDPSVKALFSLQNRAVLTELMRQLSDDDQLSLMQVLASNYLHSPDFTLGGAVDLALDAHGFELGVKRADAQSQLVSLVAQLCSEGNQVENTLSAIVLLNEKGHLNMSLMDALLNDAVSTRIMDSSEWSEMDRNLIDPKIGQDLNELGLSIGDEELKSAFFVHMGKSRSLLRRVSAQEAGFGEMVETYLNLGVASRRYNEAGGAAEAIRDQILGYLSSPEFSQACGEWELNDMDVLNLYKCEDLNQFQEWVSRYQPPGLDDGLLSTDKPYIDINSGEFQSELSKLTPEFMQALRDAPENERLEQLKAAGWQPMVPVNDLPKAQRRQAVAGDFLCRLLLDVVR